MAEKKYTKPLEDDDSESEGAARYRLPFALCKQRGIAIQDWWKPRDAWEALRRGGHIDNVSEEYAKLRREKKRAEDKVRRTEKGKEKKAREEQAKDPQHSPDYAREHKAGEIAGVKPGNAMTREEANGGKCNPHFQNASAYGYTTNCQTCVAVYEARLRGYDVRALPNNRNGYISDLSHDTTLIWVNPETGERPVQIHKGFGQRTEQYLEGNVKEGGRYTLQFMHGRGRTGHIVSIERVDGALQMYDPQSGKHYDKKQILSYLSSKSDMRLTRVDTMSFNPEYADHIMVAS